MPFRTATDHPCRAVVVDPESVGVDVGTSRRLRDWIGRVHGRHVQDVAALVSVASCSDYCRRDVGLLVSASIRASRPTARVLRARFQRVDAEHNRYQVACGSARPDGAAPGPRFARRCERAVSRGGSPDGRDCTSRGHHARDHDLDDVQRVSRDRVCAAYATRAAHRAGDHRAGPSLTSAGEIAVAGARRRRATHTEP